jgi:hypothetical protein
LKQIYLSFYDFQRYIAPDHLLWNKNIQYSVCLFVTMTIFYVFYFFRAKFLFFHSWNSPYFWDQWGAPPLTPITRWNLATRPRFIDELETSFILSPDGNRRAEFVTLPGVRPKRCCSLGDNVRLKGNIKQNTYLN